MDRPRAISWNGGRRRKEDEDYTKSPDKTLILFRREWREDRQAADDAAEEVVKQQRQALDQGYEPAVEEPTRGGAGAMGGSNEEEGARGDVPQLRLSHTED